MTNPMQRRKHSQQPVSTVKDAFQRPNDNRKRLVARVDAELHGKFKATAAMENRSINDLLEEAITTYLKRLER
ncbi:MULTISPECIES: toxin-antitoxin system HicB family antitoxin [Corynebacterium]|uniref:toxin-antitoxin system HicB family antitoxin n=1 Tax=Corynebacterium TaxID=1716 RepID=UPI00124C39B9|nr:MULTISPECIES: ribbon-helix-helix protein, CopG family [Corynebacterium]